jgi:hypothetical protein
MSLRSGNLESRLAGLIEGLSALPMQSLLGIGPAIERWQSHAAALRFHFRSGLAPSHPPLIAILGGTGVGKSTLLNRLLESNFSTSSFRRTFTAGPIAVVADPVQIPEGWLNLPLSTATELPLKGQPDVLSVAVAPQGIAGQLTLLDTPDLDGDQPLHHAQADRVFRWTQGVVFLVTPEKYQMTELLAYYALARRYHVPTLFVMNKCEQSAVLDDYARLLGDHQWRDAKIFAIPRDDATWSAPAESDLNALRQTTRAMQIADLQNGLPLRLRDLLDRFADQIFAPLQLQRQQIDVLVHSLQAMETPPPGVDVHPMTEQLQRRLQQRSVLYLMGPGRMLQRARQIPGMLARMPRTLWDTVVRGKSVTFNAADAEAATGVEPPDFRAALVEQFTVVQSRIDDALRSSSLGTGWLTERQTAFVAAKMDPALAGNIADEELASLKQWLEKRWNATPRDTVLLLRLLRYLPGGDKIVAWTEAAPYLLAIILATHYTLFGHVDLLAVGGFSLVTWLTEKLSNEVSKHVKETNRKIGVRFAELAHAQINQVIEWLRQQAPDSASLTKLQKMLDDLRNAVDD